MTNEIGTQVACCSTVVPLPSSTGAGCVDPCVLLWLIKQVWFSFTCVVECTVILMLDEDLVVATDIVLDEDLVVATDIVLDKDLVVATDIVLDDGVLIHS